MSDRVIAHKLMDGVPLGVGATYVTPYIDIRPVRMVLGVRVRPTSASAGAPDLKIDMDISDYPQQPAIPTWVTGPVPNPDNFEVPVLASWAAVNAGIRDWRMVTFASLATATVSNPPGKFVRFRFSSIGAAPADMVVDAKLEVQESM